MTGDDGRRGRGPDDRNGDKRLSRVTIRVSQVEKRYWKETARRDGLDLSSFIRRMMSIRIGSKPKHDGPPSGRSS